MATAIESPLSAILAIDDLLEYLGGISPLGSDSGPCRGRPPRPT